MNFDADNNKSREYKVEAIQNNLVYIKKSVGYLLKFFYLVFWKGYLKKKKLKSLI